MGLTLLRLSRWARGRTNSPEYPHLETLVEDESVKVVDGYHYARWIVPLVGVFMALACFMPLALTVHPLFWLGSVGMVVLGGVLGAIFHALANRISPSQILLRRRCLILGQRLSSLRSLLGVLPALSPKVAQVLEEAAQVYLSVRPAPDRDYLGRTEGVWAEATTNAQRAMDEAMAQMLTLGEPETPQAQEVELGRGWAQPLLKEMKATARTLAAQTRRPKISQQIDAPVSPLAELANARADLERLDTALSELDQEVLRN